MLVTRPMRIHDNLVENPVNTRAGYKKKNLCKRHSAQKMAVIRMIDKYALKTKVYTELNEEQRNYFFDFRKFKFLHQIDTFYYSVKLDGDFSATTCDPRVIKLRNYFKNQFEKMMNFENVYTSDLLPSDLVLKKSGFAGFYNIHLEKSEMFDIFIAMSVPSDETTQVLVQLRSNALWLYGVHETYKRSIAKLQEVLGLFGLDIILVNENRVDFCWHTNYVQDPARFLNPENVANMRVSTLGRDGDIHLEFDGNNSYEIDYFRFGRLKSNNLLFRIYLKSKEVVEQGYKGFFLKVWLLNGLINRYDLFCYEECYRRRNWGFLNKARLLFYLEYGSDVVMKKFIEKDLLADGKNPDFDTLQKVADQLTPKVTLVLNFEYQTMRKFSNSIKFLNVKNRKGFDKRIYTYLDNRKLLIEYLTHTVFRFVKYDEMTDSNKSRCEYTAFWKRLRETKLVDVHMNSHGLKLVREYSNKLDLDVVKEKVLSGLATANLYKNGVNEESSPGVDFIDFMCSLNDNDIKKFKRYKAKKVRLIGCKLDGVKPVSLEQSFVLVDKDTGELL